VMVKTKTRSKNNSSGVTLWLLAELGVGVGCELKARFTIIQ
jgi:hypothetical protein